MRWSTWEYSPNIDVKCAGWTTIESRQRKSARLVAKPEFLVLQSWASLIAALRRKSNAMREVKGSQDLGGLERVAEC